MLRLLSSFVLMLLAVGVPAVDVITTVSLPTAAVGLPYSRALSGIAGGPATWAVVAGTLPTGFSLDPATGTISGTPTAATSAAVTFSYGSATRSISVDVVSFDANSADWSAHPFTAPRLNQPFDMVMRTVTGIGTESAVGFTREYKAATLTYGGASVSAILEVSSFTGVAGKQFAYWLARGSDGSIYTIKSLAVDGTVTIENPPRLLADAGVGGAGNPWSSASSASISQQAPPGYVKNLGGTEDYVLPGIGWVQEGSSLAAYASAKASGDTNALVVYLAPRVSISGTPKPNVVLQGSVRTNAFDGIISVTLLDNSNEIQSFSSPPYSATLASVSGTHFYTIRAAFSDGSFRLSAPYIVNDGQFFSFHLSRNGITAPDGSGSFHWEAAATGSRSIAWALFTMADGGLVAGSISEDGQQARINDEDLNMGSRPVSLTALVNKLIPGTYSVLLHYTDGSEETRSGSWNTPTFGSWVSLASPANGASAIPSITLNWPAGSEPTAGNTWNVEVRPVNGTDPLRNGDSVQVSGNPYVYPGALSANQTYAIRTGHGSSNGTASGGWMSCGDSINLTVSTGSLPTFTAGSADFSGTALGAWRSFSGIPCILSVSSKVHVSDLAAAVDAGQTTWQLRTPVPVGTLLGIDNEAVIVTTNIGTQVTVERGAMGTAPAAHGAGPLFQPEHPMIGSLSQSIESVTSGGSTFQAWRTQWSINAGRSLSLWYAKASDGSIYLVRYADQRPSGLSEETFIVPFMILPAGATTGSQFYFGDEKQIETVAVNVPLNDAVLGNGIVVAGGVTQFFEPAAGPTLFIAQDFMVFRSSLAQVAQGITFNAPAPIPFTPTPIPVSSFNVTSDSGLPITFVVVSGPAVIANGALVLNGVGDVVLRAVQAGDSAHLPAMAVQTLRVTRASQYIAFAPIAPQTAGAVVQLTAASTSGLPIQYRLVSGPATLSGAALTLTGAGSVVVAVDQPGDERYLPALGASRTIVVNPAGDPTLVPAMVGINADKRRAARNQAVSIPLRLSAPRSTAVTVELTVTENTPVSLVGGTDFTLGSATFAPGTTEAKANLQLSVQQVLPKGITNLTIGIAGVSGSNAISPMDRTMIIEIHDTSAAAQPLSLWRSGVSNDWEVGALYGFQALNGTAPYTFTTSADAILQPMPPFAMAYDVDGNGTLDNGRTCTVTPKAAGPLTITVADAAGAVQSLTVTVRSPATRAVRPAAADLPLSPRQATVWRSICIPTLDSVGEILGALRTRSDVEAQGWCFDTNAQQWVMLPKLPTGGLTPGMGIYLATRVDLGLSLGGGAPEQTPRLILRPGWNLVGLPAFSQGGQAVTSVAWSELGVHDEDGLSLGMASNLAGLVGQPYAWNGVSFTAVSTLEVGRGYCIRNSSDEPPRVLTLAYEPVRIAAAEVRVRDDGPQVSVATRDVGAPPSIDGALGGASGTPVSSAAGADSGGGCGLGSGVGLLIGSLAIVSYRRRRAA